jgi:hypothetical protein
MCSHAIIVKSPKTFSQTSKTGDTLFSNKPVWCLSWRFNQLNNNTKQTNKHPHLLVQSHDIPILAGVIYQNVLDTSSTTKHPLFT